nr:NADH dehydrogenase subunit 5 [Antarctophthirus microchir]
MISWRCLVVTEEAYNLNSPILVIPLYSMLVLFVSLLMTVFETEWSVPSVLIEWNPSPTLGFMPLVVLIDKLSLSMLLTVSVVTTSVVRYGRVYMAGHINVLSFQLIMFLFVSFMCILCVSANLFTVMLGWDGLGLTSFCLIIYFTSWKSFYSGMVTLMCNRLGDIFLLTSIVVLASNSLNSWSNPTTSSMIVSVCVCIGAVSKSAMFPFSIWLPLAMAAPTPVSSLVHSSTLVTAGAYLLIRFKFLLSCSMVYLTYLSILTALVSGTLALVSFDVKKVIAYSTLSHLSLMLMFLSLNCPSSALFHLVTHAMFKSHLFMIYGTIIWTQSDVQDLRHVWTDPTIQPLVWVMLMVSTMSMIGTPFLCGYYSKELMCMMSLSHSSNLLTTFPFLLLITLTSAYSTRLLSIVVQMPVNPMRYSVCCSEHQMLGVTVTNYVFVLIVGAVLWMPITAFNEEPTSLSLLGKIYAIVAILTGIGLGSTNSIPNTLLHPMVQLSHLVGLISIDLLSWLSKISLEMMHSQMGIQFDTFLVKTIGWVSLNRTTFDSVLNSSSMLSLKVTVACFGLMLLL